MKTSAVMQPFLSEPIDTHRWTRRQYEQMVDAGVLTTDDRVELLDGYIVPMSPQDSRHANTTTQIVHLLMRVCPSAHHVRSQVPLALGEHSEPEPDVMVVEGPPDAYTDTHPSAAVLVVEVADSSLAKDRAQKRLLYARHGIPEYWLVNLIDQHLEVYRDPASGDYKSKTTLERSDTLAPRFADADLSVADLIPA
jgi:Uma2 family endonuclease